MEKIFLGPTQTWQGGPANSFVGRAIVTMNAKPAAPRVYLRLCVRGNVISVTRLAFFTTSRR